jgi:hypothetical protein
LEKEKATAKKQHTRRENFYKDYGFVANLFLFIHDFILGGFLGVVK